MQRLNTMKQKLKIEKNKTMELIKITEGNSKIIKIRNENVIPDSEVATFYGVEINNEKRENGKREFIQSNTILTKL